MKSPDSFTSLYELMEYFSIIFMLRLDAIINPNEYMMYYHSRGFIYTLCRGDNGFIFLYTKDNIGNDVPWYLWYLEKEKIEEPFVLEMRDALESNFNTINE